MNGVAAIVGRLFSPATRRLPRALPPTGWWGTPGSSARKQQSSQGQQELRFAARVIIPTTARRRNVVLSRAGGVRRVNPQRRCPERGLSCSRFFCLVPPLCSTSAPIICSGSRGRDIAPVRCSPPGPRRSARVSPVRRQPNSVRLTPRIGLIMWQAKSTVPVHSAWRPNRSSPIGRTSGFFHHPCSCEGAGACLRPEALPLGKPRTGT